MSITSLRGSTLPNKSFRAGRAKTRNVVTIAPDTATTFANGASISAGGGGGSSVTISNVSVTDSGYVLSNTTPYIDSVGGYIKITGTGFASGCTVYVGGNAASSTTFISSTEVRAQVGAAASNAQAVYVVNTDNSVGILLNAITYSGTPSWNTSDSLGTQISDIAFTIPLSATSDSSIVYTLASGSSTPSGTTLFSNGVFAGTVTGITNDTNYSFTVVATDIENQLSARAFTVTVSSGDQYFYTTPLLLNGDANVWIRDSSTNNFLPTINADAKPTAFSPYNTNWSTYFDGSNDYVTYGNTSLLTFGTGPYTIEFWYYGDPSIADYKVVIHNGAFAVYFNSSNIHVWNGANPVLNPSMNPSVPKYRWTFLQIIRTDTSTNGLKFYVDGVAGGTGTDTTNWTATGTVITSYQAGFSRAINGYVSDFRISSVARTAGVPTSRLTSDADTKLLTFQNRTFVDNSPNNISVTPTDGPAIKSFGPFVETDTTTGSGYFDGTGDYLSYASNSAFAFGTGAYTVEAWVYLTTLNTAADVIFDAGSATGSFGLFILGSSGGTPRIVYVNTYGTGQLSTLGTTTTVPFNAWTHVAVSRASTASNDTRIFINGVVSATGTDATNWTVTTTPSIGYISFSSAYYFGGYMNDVRVVKGTALYTANFTPATSSLSSVANTQLLTLQYRRGENNHRFVDEAGIKYPLTRGGQVSQGSFSPFSPAGWSVFFNGTSDFLSIPANAAFNNLSGTTFTFEFWMYPTAFASGALYNEGRTIFSTAGTFPNGWRVELTTTSVTWYDYVGSTRISYAVSLNTWTHVAFTYSSNNLIMYVNGVNRGSASSVTWNNSSGSALIGALNSGSYIYYYQGYISNLRLVAGLVYTGNFTPQTSSLTVTQSSGSNIAAITTGQTVFLTAQSNRFIDANTIPKTVTIGSGTPRIQAFSPFRPGVSYSPTLHGGSAYFDGTGDYITTVSTTSKILPAASTNTFTIDGWLYPTTLGVLSWIFGDMDATGGTNDVSVDLSSSNFVELYWYDGASKRATSTTAVVLNQWNYFAIVVNNNAITIYVNSTTAGQGGTTTLTNRTLGTSGWSMGGWNSSSYYTGYMSSIRWSNGVARTISSIPTAPPSLDANTSVLMNFTQGGVVDASARNVIETVADVKIANVQSKFGTGALSFDGTGDYLLVSPNPDLEFGSGDFTIEFWWYPTSTVRQGLYHGSFGTDWSVGIDYNGVSTNKIGIWASTNGSSWNLINGDPAGNGIGTTTISQNQWTHIAYVRSGTSWMLFVNGSRDLNLTGLSGTIVNRATSRKAIGAWWSTGSLSQASGYFDDFRISKYARYTANFTPPTSALLTK